VINSKIRFLLVGCGKIASRHADIIQSIGVLTAVCDIDSSKSDAFATRYNALSYTSLTTMIAASSADVLVVCTPNGLHAAHSIEGMKSGLHVICEKPMAIRKVDCQQMIQVSVQTGKKLFIVKQNRYNPPVAYVQSLIQNQIFGKIFSIQVNGFWNRNREYYQDSWRGTKELDGGILFTQFSHFIDLIYWWMGPVKEATGYAKNYQHKIFTAFPDTVVASLNFQNGALGAIHFSTNSFGKNMEGSVSLIGENGIVRIGGAYLNTLEYYNIKNVKQVLLDGGSPANDYGAYEGSMSNHPMVYKQVVNHISTNSIEETNMYDSMGAVEMIELIEQSLVEIY
jgi:predicted dehydrogenase